ncbi:MAG: hypothetical protein AAGA22_02850 [Pseudomonadota bacterium]
MHKRIRTALFVLFSLPALSGCIAAAIGAGAIVADEITEKDGKFDPLEEAYDGDDSTTPIIDEDK